MIVKCTKTGKILATDDEIREHSEAFGVSAFEEIEPDSTKIWMNSETGKYCFSLNELDVYLKRTKGDPANFSEVSVTEFLRRRALKAADRRNNPRVEKFANEKFLNALVEGRGYSVVPSEKALWYTKNESVAKAETWLKEHSGDSDFYEPLKIVEDVFVGEDESGVEEVPVVEQSKLSREEAQLAALELQRKLREERIVREASEAKEKELLRISQTRQMLEHQAQIEEGNRLRELAERDREKRAAEQHKAELAEKLRGDFIERFGFEPPAVAKKMAPKDQILSLLNVLVKKYDAQIVNECLSLLRTYLGNIASNSNEKKFHKIRISNKAFAEKVAPLAEATQILNACGFEDDGEFLEIKKSIADGYLCGQVVKYIDVLKLRL